MSTVCTRCCRRRATTSSSSSASTSSNEGTGTSTNCSAICVAARTARPGRDGHEILGTALTCSGIEASKSLSTATSWSTICGTGTSRIWTTGAKSASCSTVCRCTHSGGRGSAKASGRSPPGSSSNNLKSSGWGGGSPGTRPCSASRSPPPRSWPSSVPVGRRGGSYRPGASRRSAVHAARTGVTVALAASCRSLQRLRHAVAAGAVGAAAAAASAAVSAGASVGAAAGAAAGTWCCCCCCRCRC